MTTFSFTDSEVVIEQAEKMRQTIDEEDARSAMLEHIVGVAKDKPGDIVQAEELSNVSIYMPNMFCKPL